MFLACPRSALYYYISFYPSGSSYGTILDFVLLDSSHTDILVLLRDSQFWVQVNSMVNSSVDLGLGIRGRGRGTARGIGARIGSGG